MKVTLLGHASVLVETDGINCVMDPVFSDPFEEGAVVSCPERQVYPERLPKIDVLIVSHRHPDHFDIPSLARLRRDCDVICPADPLVLYALKELGFTKVHAIEQMDSIKFNGVKLFPTRSDSPEVREFGIVFKDKTGTFWNQVDTFLSKETIDIVLGECGPIDLLFAMYASQNFEFFETRAKTFPYADHLHNLETVLCINPGMVAPGSAGFRFCGAHVWVNAFLFPISRERFVADLKRLDPTLACQIMNPGDVFEIAGSTVRLHAGASKVAVTEKDDTYLIAFDPTAHVPELRDPNPDECTLGLLKRVTDRFLVEDLTEYVKASPGEDDTVLQRYRQHGVTYAVDIVFPDGSSQTYQFDFEKKPPGCSVGKERHALVDMVHRIAASALIGWMEHKKSFFYVRAYSRRFSTLSTVSRQGNGVHLEPVRLPDLLMYFLLYKAAGAELAAKHQVDLVLQELPGSVRKLSTAQPP